MKTLILLLAACVGLQAQTLKGLTTTGAATATMASFPLGSEQYQFRLENLPTTVPGSNLYVFTIATYGGNYIDCMVPSSGTAPSLTCSDSYGGGSSLNRPGFTGGSNT